MSSLSLSSEVPDQLVEPNPTEVVVLPEPKVKVLTQADIDAAKMGGAIAEQEPKQTVFSPTNENKKLKK